MTTTRLYERSIASPVGALRLFATNDALAGVHFADHRHAPAITAERSERHAVLDQAERELREYFLGTRDRFEVPLAPQGTAFQSSVWAALAEIPFGQTRSYSDIARLVGRPNSVRAVGAANGRNPIAILVPCHRVIGMDGTLTGYAGGVETKSWLLDHEARLAGLQIALPAMQRLVRAD